MSLIDKAINQRGSLLVPREVDEDRTRKLMQATELIDIANDVIERNQVDDKKRKSWSKHRTRIYDTYWSLGSLLGKLNAMNFAGIVAGSLEYFEKSCNHVQPNGEWHIKEFEVAIRNVGGEERLVMAVNFVDANNEIDLQYSNGQPAVNVNITAPAMSDEMLSALQNRGGGDDELKILLKQFISVMAEKEMAKASPTPTEEQA